MKFLPKTTAALLALITAAAFADNTRMVGVVFDPGADTAELSDELKGDESVMYRFRPSRGQVLTVSLSAEDPDTAFIVYAPGKWPGDELHNSKTDGSREYEGEIDRNGPHAVLVFRDGETTDEEENAKYDLAISLKTAIK